MNNLKKIFDIGEIKKGDKCFLWQICNLSQYENKRLFSRSFYTTEQGYKMRLVLNYPGMNNTDNQYLSLYFEIMTGEFDDNLDWPMSKTVSLEIINQRTESSVNQYYQTYSCTTGNENAVDVFGSYEFIALSELNNDSFLVDDTLMVRLRILDDLNHVEKYKLFVGEINNVDTYFLWQICNFSQFENYKLFSRSFYTTEHGYKMRLVMKHPGMNNIDNQYLSLYFQIMKGEFDDNLDWPMPKTVNLEIINQRTESSVNQYYKTYSCTTCNEKDEERFDRPSEVTNDTFGTNEFMHKCELNNNSFLVDDTLMVRLRLLDDLQHREKYRLFVGEIKNGDKCFLWQICNFSKYENKKFFSRSFYTTNTGYKMCLVMKHPGMNNPDNQYLSLYFQIMKGEFDDNLDWPMSKTVSLEIINQQTESSVNQYYQTYSCTTCNENDVNVFDRPQNKTNVLFGSNEFMALSELNNNSFLVEDTLIVRLRMLDYM